MANPVYNKIKGKEFEREVVKKMREFNFEAHRTFGSTGASEGREPDVDVVLKLYPADLQFQCERVKKLRAKYRKGEHLTGVIFREDHGEPVIMINLDMFLALLKVSEKAFKEKGS